MVTLRMLEAPGVTSPIPTGHPSRVNTNTTVGGGSNVVSSSSSSDDVDEDETLSACDEETLHAAVDDLEEREGMEVDSSNGNAENLDYPREGHTVEYWTVDGENEPKHLVKQYLMNNNAGGNDFMGGTPLPVAYHQIPTTPTYPDQYVSYTSLPLISLTPVCQFTPVLTSPKPPTLYSTMHIFVPATEQQHYQNAHFITTAPIPHYSQSEAAATPSFGFQSYYPHAPPPVSINGAARVSAVSMYQGAPLYFQGPPAEVQQGMDLYPLEGGYLRHSGAGIPLESVAYGISSFPPAESMSSTEPFVPSEVSLDQCNSSTSVIEPDSTTKENYACCADNEATSPTISSTAGEIVNSWQLQNYLVTSTSCDSPTVSSSSFDSDSGLMMEARVRMGDESSYATLGSGSNLSSPVSTSSFAEIDEESSFNTSGMSGSGDFSRHGSSEEDVSTSTMHAVDEKVSNGMFEACNATSTSVGFEASCERYSMEWRATNDAQLMDVMMQEFIAIPLPQSTPYHREEMIYPGDLVILMYFPNEGNSSVILYNSQEIPYVANSFDQKIQTQVKMQARPICYSYYVPPRTADDDYFGGQLAMWQMKMVQYFLKFQPGIWKMYGVPESFNFYQFLASVVDSIDEFHIVSKLRFCCRTCNTPWTSKKGTIVFKFCYNRPAQKGWILMRIFGQICMKESCKDWTFQTPACYPEEIDRAMKKLSEYVGQKCYGLRFKPNNFAECYKSIRNGGPSGSGGGVSAPHKKEYCQACMNGVCKNLHAVAVVTAFAKPFQLRRKSCVGRSQGPNKLMCS